LSVATSVADRLVSHWEGRRHGMKESCVLYCMSMCLNTMIDAEVAIVVCLARIVPEEVGQGHVHKVWNCGVGQSKPK